MSKTVGVLFSGGLDSTYLIWKNLSDGNVVVPIYAEILNNKDKSVIEKNRVELLFNEFRKEFGDKIKYVEYPVNIQVQSSDGLFFKQLPIWLLSMLYSHEDRIDEFQIGYVMNDDMVSYVDDVKNIYKSYESVMNFQIPLTFPLLKNGKNQIADKLPSKYLSLTYSCENPRIIGDVNADYVDYEPCCKCPACKKIISSDYYDKGLPSNYRKAVNDKMVGKLLRDGYTITSPEGIVINNTYEVMASCEPVQLRLQFPEENDEQPITLESLSDVNYKYDING